MDKDNFKKLFLVVSLVVIVFLGMGAAGPKYTEVERSIEIDAPQVEVYQYISNLSNMESWHFWKNYDPNIKYQTEGIVGSEGAKLNWEGNEQVGKGSIDIRKADAPRFLEMDLQYTEPWEALASNSFVISPNGNGSKITWSYKAKNKFISRMSMLFMNMDKMLGADYEESLIELKERIERD